MMNKVILEEMLYMLRGCEYCQQYKGTRVQAPLQPIVATKIRERGVYDIMGIVDTFSRKVWTTALETKESAPIVDWLKETSAVFSDFIHSIGAKEIHSAPYHPQTNGKIERFWGTLKSKIKSVGQLLFAFHNF